MAVKIEQYGRYEIKSGPVKGEWGANAFRRKMPIAKAVGSTEIEAIEKVKSKLDSLDSQRLSECDDEGAPSASVYADAFLAVLPTVSDGYIAMLKAHFNASNHLISATKLAEAAGYAGYEAANLHYGKLSALIAEEIGFVPPKRADGSEMWTCTIARAPEVEADFSDPILMEEMVLRSISGHFQWRLRPQVVEALTSINF